jgi:hypothetical protein
MNAARFRLVCAHYHIKSSLFLVVVVVALVLKFSVSIFRRPKNAFYSLVKKKSKIFLFEVVKATRRKEEERRC